MYTSCVHQRVNAFRMSVGRRAPSAKTNKVVHARDHSLLAPWTERTALSDDSIHCCSASRAVDENRAVTSIDAALPPVCSRVVFRECLES